MKTSRRAVALVVVALLAGAAVFTWSRKQFDSASAPGVLHVDQVAASPERFAGQDVRLAGIVSAVLPEQHLFAVIDQAEYAACKVVTCSQYQVPIAYGGDLPAVEASITVTGRLVEPEPGRYLFQATALELNQ